MGGFLEIAKLEIAQIIGRPREHRPQRVLPDSLESVRAKKVPSTEITPDSAIQAPQDQKEAYQQKMRKIFGLDPFDTRITVLYDAKDSPAVKRVGLDEEERGRKFLQS